MSLGGLTPEMLREAVAIFLEEAYGGDAPRGRVPDLAAVSGVEEALRLMEEESAVGCDGERTRRWTLRLGNSRYPHMKLVLAEWAPSAELLLAVDSHDAVTLPEWDPDVPQWEELRSWNGTVKRRIVERWKQAGLPI